MSPRKRPPTDPTSPPADQAQEVTTQPGKNERNFRGSRRSGLVTGTGEPGAV